MKTKQILVCDPDENYLLHFLNYVNQRKIHFLQQGDFVPGKSWRPAGRPERDRASFCCRSFWNRSWRRAFPGKM